MGFGKDETYLQGHNNLDQRERKRACHIGETCSPPNWLKQSKKISDVPVHLRRPWEQLRLSAALRTARKRASCLWHTYCSKSFFFFVVRTDVQPRQLASKFEQFCRIATLSLQQVELRRVLCGQLEVNAISVRDNFEGLRLWRVAAWGLSFVGTRKFDLKEM
jgi:hypothetical protein